MSALDADAYRAAVESALSGALTELHAQVTLVRQAFLHRPVVPRTARRFSLTSELYMRVNPALTGTGGVVGIDFDVHGEPIAIPHGMQRDLGVDLLSYGTGRPIVLGNLVDAVWTKPRRVLRVLRRIQAAGAWVSRVELAALREWDSYQADPRVAVALQEIRARASEKALEEKDRR